jgi:hypothetical protein
MLGLFTAAAHLLGESYEKNAATGAVLATPDNMNEPPIRRLLVPDLSVLSKDAR